MYKNIFPCLRNLFLNFINNTPMDHVLKTLHWELERTHNLVEHYKAHGIHERFFALFWKSFKKILEKYAKEKEAVLMDYATLHYDIWREVKHPSIELTDVEHVKLWISALTFKIESCSKYLSQLISHSQRQEDILDHEKMFFANLIKSFNADLTLWVSWYERETFWEISSVEIENSKNPLENSKLLLQKQKQRLEQHIEKLSNLQNND